MKRIFILFITLTLAAIATRAQSALGNGDERTSRKWRYIETPTFKVIYPLGLDSLARVYASELEKGVEPISYSSSLKVNQSYKYKWPVILHGYSALSNGMVAYPPHRTELYTTPDPYAPIATPWERHLTLHETRHVAQLQFSVVKPFRWTKVLFGGYSEAFWTFLYGGSTIQEGDAVYAETALTNSGRGRSADFLEYMRVALGQGVKYSFYDWQYGMLNHYTPDFYRVSYVYYAGLRAYYGVGDFNTMYRNNFIQHNGIDLFWKNTLAKQIGGKKFKPLFLDIADKLTLDWKKDEDNRAPFMPTENFSVVKGRYTDFQNLVSDGETLYAIRSGIAKPRELVKMSSDGSAKVISKFSSYASMMRYSPITGRIYWSEYTPNARWGEESYSDIYYFAQDGKHHRLTKGERYYNPSPSNIDNYLAVVNYPFAGGSSVDILDINSGKIIKSYKAPDGLQIVEAVWIDKDIYISALSSDGFGIYKLDGFRPLLTPEHTQIKQLFSYKDKIYFTSDLSGVNELYSLNPQNCELTQMTTTRYGAADFCFSPDGDKLYYSSLETEARYIASTSVKDLTPKKVPFKSTAVFPIADKLNNYEPVRYDENANIEISDAKTYSKLANSFKIHSWIPAYANFDSISSISASDITSALCLGATVFGQNELNTSSGSISYKIDPFTTKGKVNHAGTISYTYSGLFPIFETKLFINHRDLLNYSINEDTKQLIGSYKDPSGKSSPNITAQVRSYVPFNFSSGGWQRGLIPSLTFAYTNDKFYINKYARRNMSKFTASLRGYIIEPTPSAQKYPRFGIGAEAGYSIRPEVIDFFSSGSYFYLYGYLPGLTEIQGLKFSALYQHQLKQDAFTETLATIVPRGYKDDINTLLTDYANATKISIDYNIPFLEINYCLLGFFYFRNLELEPHFDFSAFSDSRYIKTNLWSAGADLLLRIQTANKPVRIGVSFNYLGGDLYPRLKQNELISKPFSIGLAMNMSL